MIGAWITGALLGLTSGTVEASWTDSRIQTGDRRKLPHGLLWCARVVACLVLAWIQAHVFCYDCARHVVIYDAGVMFAVLCVIHRPQYNLWRDSKMIRWWYMGVRLPHRRHDDSFYDGLFHRLARITGEDYNARLPFILATCVELCAALILTINL